MLLQRIHNLYVEFVHHIIEDGVGVHHLLHETVAVSSRSGFADLRHGLGHAFFAKLFFVVFGPATGAGGKQQTKAGGEEHLHGSFGLECASGESLKKRWEHSVAFLLRGNDASAAPVIPCAHATFR